jgi:hypothetical protein
VKTAGMLELRLDNHITARVDVTPTALTETPAAPLATNFHGRKTLREVGCVVQIGPSGNYRLGVL